jgi:hypothetical protein
MDTTTKNKTATPLVTSRAAAPRVAGEFTAFDEVLGFAMEQNTRSYDLYCLLSEKAKRPSTRRAFADLAGGKYAQRAKLETAQREGALRLAPENVPSLKVTDYVTADVVARDDMDAREALIYAIRLERDVLRLYTDLADNPGDHELQDLFLALAQDQARYLLDLEMEYEDHIFAQN